MHTTDGYIMTTMMIECRTSHVLLKKIFQQREAQIRHCKPTWCRCCTRGHVQRNTLLRRSYNEHVPCREAHYSIQITWHLIVNQKLKHPDETVAKVTYYTDHFKDAVSCSGFKKSIFFGIFRKYNILRVYCNNFRPQYDKFTKLQHIVESAPRFINSI